MTSIGLSTSSAVTAPRHASEWLSHANTATDQLRWHEWAVLFIAIVEVCLQVDSYFMYHERDALWGLFGRAQCFGDDALPRLPVRSLDRSIDGFFATIEFGICVQCADVAVCRGRFA